MGAFFKLNGAHSFGMLKIDHNYSQISAKYHGLQSWSFSDILLLIMWGLIVLFHKTIKPLKLYHQNIM